LLEELGRVVLDRVLAESGGLLQCVRERNIPFGPFGKKNASWAPNIQTDVPLTLCCSGVPLGRTTSSDSG
jgi:hypothetical protein